MAREAVRNEPSVSCSLKERGLSTARVALACNQISFMYLLHSFFSFFCIGTNYMLAMGVYVRQWLLINSHLMYAYLFLFLC